MAKRLFIIVPCYNEEAVLPITAPLFLAQLKHMISLDKCSEDSRILFVNDGSKDGTWDIICSLSRQDPHFAGISQSRNRGHQNAVLAGLMEAKELCDVTVSIDCDGQDDMTAMEQMLDAFNNEGCDVVYGIRSNRDTDTFFKRFTAEAFYKVMEKMGVETVFNHADYRLISARALKAFADFTEVNLFLRGMVPLVGFKSTGVYYRREERLAGESHYPLKKMVALAVEGITGLSVKPIRLITFGGLAVCGLSLAALIAAVLWCCLWQGPLWAVAFALLAGLGGLELTALGVVGEYVGKTYMEAKRRPRYIISARTWEEEA